jgi:hypothetical protein
MVSVYFTLNAYFILYAHHKAPSPACGNPIPVNQEPGTMNLRGSACPVDNDLFAQANAFQPPIKNAL